MAFRDDREAAQARADALDREVRRLEEENAQLRVERERERGEIEASRDRRARLEALAAEAPRPAKAARASKPKRPKAETDRQHKLRLAFSSPWTTTAFVVLLLVTMVALYLVGISVLMAIGIPFPPLLIPFMLPGVFVMWWLYTRVMDLEVRRTRRWLEALPFRLDVPAYVDFMASNFRGTLTLELDIPGAGREDRELFARAVVGGARGSTAAWNGDTLVVTSPALKVYYSGKGGGTSHNAKPHRWFKRFARRVLGPIAAQQPIARVRVAT